MYVILFYFSLILGNHHIIIMYYHYPQHLLSLNCNAVITIMLRRIKHLPNVCQSVSGVGINEFLNDTKSSWYIFVG